MNAFWSGTDDQNEKGRKLRMYSVYGHIHVEAPAYKIRVGFLGDFYDIDLDFIFDIPYSTTYETNESLVETDEETGFSKIVNTKVTTTDIASLEQLPVFDETSEVTVVQRPTLYTNVTVPEESRYPETWWKYFKASVYTKPAFSTQPTYYPPKPQHGRYDTNYFRGQSGFTSEKSRELGIDPVGDASHLDYPLDMLEGQESLLDDIPFDHETAFDTYALENEPFNRVLKEDRNFRQQEERNEKLKKKEINVTKSVDVNAFRQGKLR